MTAHSIEEKIRKYIADNFLFNDSGYPYSDDTSFLENGVIDSMNVMELVMFAEETCNITIQDDEIIPENFDSVSRLAAFIRQKSPIAS